MHDVLISSLRRKRTNIYNCSSFLGLSSNIWIAAKLKIFSKRLTLHSTKSYGSSKLYLRAKWHLDFPLRGLSHHSQMSESVLRQVCATTIFYTATKRFGSPDLSDYLPGLSDLLRD